MEYPRLSKAPVKEAIVDIRVQPNTTIDPDRLLKLHESFRADYPHVQVRSKWQGQLSFSPKVGASSAEVKETGIDGYIFSSADKLNVVQMRLDGFSYSRLAPYTEWKAIRPEANRLWDIYTAAIGGLTATRVAMRYINVLDLAGSPSDAEKFIEKSPTIPTSLESRLAGYFEQNFLEDVREGFRAVMIQAIQPPPVPSKFDYILDIDVFLEAAPIPLDSIWSTLDKLRGYKNRLFFNTLKQTTWEKYQ